MWYAVGKIHASASGSVLASAHDWANPWPSADARSNTVWASGWSAVGFLAGWSSTSVSCLPAIAAATADSTWAEVKS